MKKILIPTEIFDEASKLSNEEKEPVAIYSEGAVKGDKDQSILKATLDIDTLSAFNTRKLVAVVNGSDITPSEPSILEADYEKGKKEAAKKLKEQKARQKTLKAQGRA